MSVEEFFDTTAERYDRRYDDPGAGGRLLPPPRGRRRAAGRAPGKVLDVGMGTGRLCAELDRRGWQVSGVDLSPAMVAAARRRLPDIADRLVEGAIEQLPFPEPSSTQLRPPASSSTQRTISTEQWPSSHACWRREVSRS